MNQGRPTPAYTRRGTPLPGPDTLPAGDGQVATYNADGSFEGWVSPVPNLSPITLDAANGRVGIGTTSPQYPLHVSESNAGMSYTELRNSVVSGAGADTGGVGIRFVAAVSNMTQPCGRIKSNFVQNNYISSRIVFQTVTGPSVFTDAFTLQNGGAVVGDSSLARKFDVVGSPATGSIGTERVFQIRRNVNPTISFPQVADFAIGRYSTAGNTTPRSRLDLYLADTTTATPTECPMTWQGDCHVGINNTSPAGMLHATAKAATDPVLVAQGIASQTGNLIEARDATGVVLSEIGPKGSFKPASLADADAPNDTIYKSTDAGKLVYKDESGVVNALY